MLKLNLPYSSIYEQVFDLLEKKYNEMGYLEDTNINLERDVDIIALKLADEVLEDKEIWSCVAQDIKDMCLDHMIEQQKLFANRSGNTNKELQEKLEENDCKAGKLLLTMISQTICDVVANNLWEKIKEAEREVYKYFYEQKKQEMYG
jgi:hypothetical protein